MKRLIGLVACVFISVFSIIAVSSGKGDDANVYKKQDPVKPDQSRPTGEIAPNRPEQSSPFKTQREKVSYAIGVSMVGNLKQQGAVVDPDLVIRGMKDAFSGEKLLMSDKEIQKILKIYLTEVRQQQAKARKAIAERNRQEGEAFLAENKKKEGVVSLPGGLQYKIVKEGDGRKPTDTDTVECRYRGKLIDGTEFDSSYRTGRPATFKVANVIPGWREALKLMPVGSTWQLFIPPELGYGERGGGGNIGPNAALVFEVDLLAIK